MQFAHLLEQRLELRVVDGHGRPTVAASRLAFGSQAAAVVEG